MALCRSARAHTSPANVRVFCGDQMEFMLTCLPYLYISLSRAFSSRAREPWYPPIAEYKWAMLPTRYRALASPTGAYGAQRVAGDGSGGDGGSVGERILLAPPWLISADNALGHRYKHWLYGATPTPCVMLHFVCVAAGERSRILPMQLFRRWHHRAVDAEVEALNVKLPSPGSAAATAASAASATSVSNPADSASASASASTSASTAVSTIVSVPTRPRMIALAGATIESALAPRPWPELNVLNALLGGLAVLSDRALVLPALNCTRTVEADQVGTHRLRYPFE